MSIIVNKGHKALSSVSYEVAISDISSPTIKEILKNMKIALGEQDDGVAIAAPQIGQNLCIFMLSPLAYEDNYTDQDLVFINPKITKYSKEKKYMMEGCLSVRWLYGEVARSKKVNIEYYDIKGNKKNRGATGLLSQVFQHEIDHLAGILFDSKAKNLENIPPEKLKEMQK